MKSRKNLLMLVLISLLLCAMSACSKKAVEEELSVYSYDELDKDEIILQNDHFEFHFVPETTQFYIVNKDTGYIWNSNPKGAEADTIAAAVSKEELQSTLMIKYNTESGTETTMNNYGSSIARGNYTYEVLNDTSLKVNYTIANIPKEYLVPNGVPEARFKQFSEQFDKGTQSKLMMAFQVYDIDKLKGDDKAAALEMFPDLETVKKVYAIREAAQPYLKQNAEELFATIGYTQEDYEQDSAIYNLSSTHDKPIYNVSMIYELQEEGLVVSIPLSEIKYKSTHPIVSIKTLPFFGAGGVEDQGFILVPDGSGAIINFNNQKQSQLSYISDVFGYDYGLVRNSVVDETRANMPIFGISNNESSYLCVLEEGSSYGYIEASVSGHYNSYNNAAANYYLVRNALMDISAKSDRTVRMFQDGLPNEIISQRYIFIDDNDYISMAETYRNYLMDRNEEMVKRSDSDLPVAVELLGAVDRTKHIIGIPTRKPYELTSYNEAIDITNQLIDIGITDLNIKYNGWFNDGVLHKTPNKVKLVDELGSKKSFKKLVKLSKENDVNLYLASTFQFVYDNSMFDNFVAIKDSAKYVNRKLVELLPYSKIWYGQETEWYEYYLAKPDYYIKNIEQYASEIEDLGIKNIAFGDIGYILSADYNPKSLVTRQQAMKMQVDKLKGLRAEGYKAMITSGNIYAVPYADFIIDVNLKTKGYNIIDEEIPFYEIVLHGLVSYAGGPINLADNYESSLLETIETGAGLYFVFMGADSFELQDSRYTSYFSSDFTLWSEKTKKLYNDMKKDLGHIYNQYITDHKKLAEGVTLTEYEDGTQVIVNYNHSAYIHNGKEVPARGYIVEGGKQ